MALQALPNTKEEHAQDPVWLQICGEVEDLVRNEPMMADFLNASVLSHSSLESALSSQLGHQVDCATVPARVLCNVISEAFTTNDDIRGAMRADLLAVIERDSEIGRAHV